MKKAFVSYSSNDEVMVDRLLTHVKVLEHEGKLEVWHDGQIGAGKEWEKEINKQLDSSDIVILCVSADFLASEPVETVEIPKALSLHEARKCIVISVILRPCAWKEHRIARLQVIPKRGKPVSEYDDEEEAWKEIIEAIAKAIKSGPRRVEPSPSIKPRNAQPRRSQQVLVDHEADKIPTRAIITVHNSDTELAGVDVLALFPNHTCRQATTDTQAQAHLQLHSSHLPMTVFAAAPGYAACIEHDWVPSERPLALEMTPLPNGGAVIFPKDSGTLPGLIGGLNPVRDWLDRTYLHTDNIAVNGRVKLAYFEFGEELHLTDADGNERWARIIAIEGHSALVEYRMRPYAASEQ